MQYEADINLPDGQGNTPLHHVRNVSCTNILLAAGADITVRNEFCHTPLHTVCRTSGSLPLLKTLIKTGIDIHAEDHRDETALGNAIFMKHVDCVLQLIRQGADVDNTSVVGVGGESHIAIAIVRDLPAVLQLLLAHGANYTGTDSFNRTILHSAVETTSERTIEILISHGLQGIDVEVKDLDEKTVKDMLNKHSDDDANPDFKAKAHKLLDAIAAAQHSKVISAVTSADQSEPTD